jgi:hypothetical protein
MELTNEQWRQIEPVIVSLTPKKVPGIITCPYKLIMKLTRSYPKTKPKNSNLIPFY